MPSQVFPENNLQTVSSLDNFKAKSIDFTRRFEKDLKDLQQALGIMRKLPVVEGMKIKFYDKPTVELADGNVAEGDIIPLSKVTPKVHTEKEMTLKKYRKATSAEAIQTYGLNDAINITDRALVQELQTNVRNDLFTFIQKAGTKPTSLANGLQGALATAWGTIQELFEGTGGRVIVFANPMDVAEHIAKAQLTTQTSFGLSYVTDFSGVTVVTSHRIAKGKVYATVQDNLVVAYIPAHGAAGQSFGLTSDSTGFLGMKHFMHNETMTQQTLLMSGILLFPERLDGVVEIEIKKEVTA